jgi:hypothetical protein
MQLLKNFPTLYGTWRFITMFTRALHWSLSWNRSIQSIPPHPIYLRSILYYPPTYALVFLVVSFLQAFYGLYEIYNSWNCLWPLHGHTSLKSKLVLCHHITITHYFFWKTKPIQCITLKWEFLNLTTLPIQCPQLDNIVQREWYYYERNKICQQRGCN